MLIQDTNFNGNQPVVKPALDLTELEMSRVWRVRKSPLQIQVNSDAMGAKATAVTGSKLHGAVCTHALGTATGSWDYNPIFGKTCHFQHWNVVI